MFCVSGNHFTDYKMNTAKFKRLRALIVYRLTMYNGRRGVNPEKMTMTDWVSTEQTPLGEEREQFEQLHPMERGLMQNCILGNMTGNNGHAVPILIPHDTVLGIRELLQLRSSVPINPENIYLFPTCNGSLGHIKRSQAMDEVCRKTMSLLRAEDFTHITLTIYTLNALPEQERRSYEEQIGLCN
jgi:hypothetical protein